MVVVQSVVMTSTIGLTAKQTQVQASGFGAFMAQADARGLYVEQFIDALFTTIRDNTGAKPSGAAAQNTYAFPFSAEFQDVFGSDGPLFNFIDATSIKLGLSAEKNLALQQIAINNKDIVKSPENVQKIGAELRAAGIT